MIRKKASTRFQYGIRVALIVLSLLVAIVLVAHEGRAIGPQTWIPTEREESISRDLKLFEEVVGKIKKNYVDTVTYKDMVFSAIKEMVLYAGKERMQMEGDLDNLNLASGDNRIVIRPSETGAGKKMYMEEFSQAYLFIKRNLFDNDKEKAHRLMESAIRGVTKGLDPNSSYIKPEAYKELWRETEGMYDGLGLEMTLREGRLRVLSVFEGSPAEALGIRPGDEITAIDGEPTEGIGLVNLVRKIRGPKGTRISLTILRSGVEGPLDLTATRDTIKVKSVYCELFDGNIAYIKVTSFNRRTSSDFERKVSDLMKKGVRGLILDLRNNPGGLLDESVKVAECFLENGKLVVSTDSRLPKQKMQFFSHHRNEVPHFPTIVIINGGSASASEVVASALRDHGKALLLGDVSYGKATVQSLFSLSNGGALKLTVARYYTPAGANIHNEGVVPDVLFQFNAVPTRDPGSPFPRPDILEQKWRTQHGAEPSQHQLVLERNDLEQLELMGDLPREESEPDVELALAKLIISCMPPDGMARYVRNPEAIMELLDIAEGESVGKHDEKESGGIARRDR